ncbi:MAG: hypothetical protein D8M57_11130 [Candidatus Scalindua sp. AMX11]|nr:MAG: hypothetical protein DWQ00_15925 [Candidatus Scalindua sp.]NOG83691.1 hypothetical protein [Planctomycetota bacterium]RZV73859.1 MAG: hypothetical protein EX341_13465 [Candidatus Scalindua sp. SCAELEC01]TDE64866.1 MAG: hypothetical protein D8M57_11130 [Candidatus Scalindua sp. AMX11]GJQ60642.1 MAG: hypothetical protein SCALA701_34430 [Candidatus Scalindua sp.]
MDKKCGLLVFCIVFILFASLSNTSEGIELHPTQEQIDEAIKYGETHTENIFESELVKPATFGEWPDFGGGIIKSKLVSLSIISAMKVRAKKKITDEDVTTILESDTLAISYRGGEDLYKIKLMQGTRVIEPKAIKKPEMGKNSPKHKAHFIVTSFPYEEIDLNAKSWVIVEKDFGTKRYDVDFSRFK